MSNRAQSALRSLFVKKLFVCSCFSVRINPSHGVDKNHFNQQKKNETVKTNCVRVIKKIYRVWKKNISLDRKKVKISATIEKKNTKK